MQHVTLLSMHVAQEQQQHAAVTHVGPTGIVSNTLGRLPVRLFRQPCSVLRQSDGSKQR